MYATNPVWEGPTAALRRYYRDGPTAEFRSDVLLESTFSQGVPSSRTIVGVEFGQPRQVAAALCHRGGVYGNPKPITISRSDDGGVTWRDQLGAGVPAGSGSLIDLDGPTLIIRRLTAADTWSFIRVSPSGRDVLPLPAGVPLTAARLRNSGGVAGAAVFLGGSPDGLGLGDGEGPRRDTCRLADRFAIGTPGPAFRTAHRGTLHQWPTRSGR